MYLFFDSFPPSTSGSDKFSSSFTCPALSLLTEVLLPTDFFFRLLMELAWLLAKRNYSNSYNQHFQVKASTIYYVQMNFTGMLVVSFRGCKIWILVSLMCYSRRNLNYFFAHQYFFRMAYEDLQPCF